MRLQNMIRQGTVLTLAQIKSDPLLVTEIQRNLINIGLLADRDSRGTSSADGSFGPKTEAALARFCETFFLDNMRTGRFGKTFAEVLLREGARGGGGGTGGGGATTGGTGTGINVTVDQVKQMFPSATPRSNIATYLPPILNALRNLGLGDKNMVLMALGTIRAETAGFVPISEFKSQFNTSAGGHPFNKYDNRSDLGNRGRPDGDRYKGRGFIQLTGRANYRQIGQQIGVDLENNPDRANEPDIAARILARYLKNKESAIRSAIARNDLALARKLVNGGSHGLGEFTETFNKGRQII